MAVVTFTLDRAFRIQYYVDSQVTILMSLLLMLVNTSMYTANIEIYFVSDQS